MRKIWSANTKLVSGKTLASVATVTNTASVERNMFNIFSYVKFCLAMFKEDFQNTKRDVMGE